MLWLIKIFIIQVSLLFLVSCGGGGGGAGSSINYTTEYNNQEGLALIGADSINSVATGSGIKVAVNDTGIDADHQEFSDKTIYGTDFAGTGNAKYDGHGHGSHVAGIIAADKDGVGMRGVAYNATLYSYKIGIELVLKNEKDFNDKGIFLINSRLEPNPSVASKSTRWIISAPASCHFFAMPIGSSL